MTPMSGTKPDLDAMHRLLHRHEWSHLEDWVRALGDLADLTDQQIEALTKPSAKPAIADRAAAPLALTPRPALPQPQPASTAPRSIQPPPSRRAPR